MKQITLLIIACLFSSAIFAQTPQAISYQAIARNATGVVLASQSVGIKISIHSGSATGTVEYSETHHDTTNLFGLFTLQIGNGTPITGTFSGIDWSIGNKFLQVELDAAGGTTYSDMGTTQLLSVPYALYAEKTNLNLVEGNGIQISGDTIINSSPNIPVSITGSGDVTVSGTYPNFNIDGTPSTFFAGTGIQISNDSIINSSPDQIVSLTGTGITNVAGAYPNFTINTPAYTAGTGIGIVGNVISNNSPDQIVSITGLGQTTVTGTYPNFSIATVPYLAGTGIQISNDSIINSSPDVPVNITGTGSVTVTGSYPNFNIDATDNVNDADHDSTNELQTLSKTGNTISLSKGGGSVTDSDNQNLSKTVNGTNVTIHITNGNSTTFSIADNDNDSTNELNTALSFNTITNMLSVTDAGGTLTDTVDVNEDDLSDNSITDLNDVNTTGAQQGDLLQYDGTNWIPSSPANFSLQYPDGLNNAISVIQTIDINTTYTVPANYNFYLTALHDENVINYIMINGIHFDFITNPSSLAHTPNSPLILKSGDVISLDGVTGFAADIFGFLVKPYVIPVSAEFNNGTSFTVPAGKSFVILNIKIPGLGSVYFSVNGHNLFDALFQGYLPIPVILNAGDVISFSGGVASILPAINGYLK